MTFSLNNPTSYSALGSLGAHLIFVAFAGNYILSQDRLIPPPRKIIKLEVVKKKPPVKKEPIKEIVRKQIETPVPIKPRELQKIQEPTRVLEVVPVNRIVPSVKPMEHIPVQTPATATRQNVVQTSVTTRSIHTASVVPRSARSVHVSSNASSARSSAVSVRATRVAHSAPAVRTVQSVAVSTSTASGPVSSVGSRAVRTTHSVAAPRRFQAQATGTKVASRGGRLIRSGSRRVTVASVQARAVQSATVSPQGQGKGKRLLETSAARMSLVQAAPRKLDAPGAKPQAGTLQTALLSSGAARFPASAFEPRPVPNVIDQGALRGYSRGVQRKIAARKKYPKKARREGKQGQVTIQFTVLKSGDIRDLLLVSKTPYEELNEAALNAVRRAAPFASLPDEIGQDFLELVLPFKFEIK